MNELKNKYSKLSDNELLVIAYFESSDYNEKAIKTAKSILDKRGLNNPSDEILQKVKNYHNQTKEAQRDKFVEDIQSGDIFKYRKLKQAFKEKKYSFIGNWLFWFIVGYGIYSGLGIGAGGGKWIDLIPFVEMIKSEWLFVLEVVFNIAILGIFPVVFFIIYSLTLSSSQRKERGLSLFMPKYIFFIYGTSLSLFLVLVVIP